jgi:hypothetical protein
MSNSISPNEDKSKEKSEGNRQHGSLIKNK